MIIRKRGSKLIQLLCQPNSKTSVRENIYIYISQVTWIISRLDSQLHELILLRVCSRTNWKLTPASATETRRKAVKVRRAGLPGEGPAQLRRIPGMPSS